VLHHRCSDRIGRTAGSLSPAVPRRKDWIRFGRSGGLARCHLGGHAIPDGAPDLGRVVVIESSVEAELVSEVPLRDF
jgi:hypothetical protein